MDEFPSHISYSTCEMLSWLFKLNFIVGYKRIKLKMWSAVYGLPETQSRWANRYILHWNKVYRVKSRVTLNVNRFVQITFKGEIRICKFDETGIVKAVINLKNTVDEKVNYSILSLNSDYKRLQFKFYITVFHRILYFSLCSPDKNIR